MWLTERIGVPQIIGVLVGLLWLGWGTSWSSLATVYPVAPTVGVLCTGAGVLVMALSLLIHEPPSVERLQRILFVGSLVLVGSLLLATASAHSYMEDEVAYDQAAAVGVLHGQNPYGRDLSSATQDFGVGFSTFTLKGELVREIAYPSLSFEAYVPAVAVLGERSNAAAVVDIIAWLLAGVILWKALGQPLRPLATLLLLLPVPMGWVWGGNDALYVPLLLLALWRWDGRVTLRGVGGAISPAALGLACAVKQTPWLVAPFLVAGVAIELHHAGLAWRRGTVRYCAIAAAAFVVPNLPFIVWDARAWFSSITLPFTRSLVPDGIGVAGLIRTDGVAGGGLGLLSAGSELALIAALVAFLRYYAQLKLLLPVLPLAGFFVADRSLGSYFAFLVPAIILVALTTTPVATVVWPAGRRLLAASCICLCTLAATTVVVGLLRTSPLQVALTEATATNPGVELTVRVSNSTAASVSPRFLIVQDGFTRGLLSVIAGPPEVPAHAEATYRLRGAGSILPLKVGDSVAVSAVTASPDTISTSAIAPLT